MTAREQISDILHRYRNSFSSKTYNEENTESDILMELFGITSEIKMENRQYWGRELGLCWEKIITEVITSHRDDYLVPEKLGKQEIFDTGFGEYAIDTKYRIGSGDSGTLKKFRSYAEQIKELGKTPVLLILRTDNLKTAIRSCETAGWIVITGEESMNFIQTQTGFNLKEYLLSNKGQFHIDR